jgi:pimeloyl-ACP methyl ester carboxylesterase
MRIESECYSAFLNAEHPFMGGKVMFRRVYSAAIVFSFLTIAFTWPVAAQQVEPPPLQQPPSLEPTSSPIDEQHTQDDRHSTPLSVISTRVLQQGDNLIHGFMYYNGSLWASTRTSPARILKIDPETLNYDRITLASGLNNGEDIIAAESFIWVVIYTQPTRLIRLDPATLEWQVAITFNSSEHSFGGSLVYAFDHLWIGGYDRKIAKVNLTTLNYQIFSYPSQNEASQFHAITHGGGYIWASTPHYSNAQQRWYGNTIVKIDPNNPTSSNSVFLNTPFADDIAYINGSLYINSEVPPSYIFKINSDLSYRSTAAWNTASYGAFTNPLAPDRIYGAYIGFPGKVIEFDTNLNISRSYSLPGGFRDANEIAFDESGYMYATSWDSPARITKFSPPSIAAGLDPLIFIPGITGSYLDKTGVPVVGRLNVWPSIGLGLYGDLLLDPDRKPWPDVIATDVIREIRPPIVDPITVYEAFLRSLVDTGYREYQVRDNPNARTAAGCDLSQNSGDPAQKPNLFVFAYDWRLDNAHNASKEGASSLSEYVACVQKFWPGRKVTIITHSMGGLLARRYIIDHPTNHNVDKLITIAAPWLGAPRAINVLETGDFGLNPFLITRPTVAQLAQFSPGAHHLLPSRAYYELGGSSFIEDGWDLNETCKVPADYDNNCHRETYNPAQLQTMLDLRYPWSKQGQVKPAELKPGSNASVFHEYRNSVGWQQDDWRSDTSGVTYYHIYGNQPTAQTIGRVRAVATVICSPQIGILPRTCTPPTFTSFKVNSTDMVRGDDTVPVISASRLKAGGANFNAQRATTVIACYEPSPELLKHSELTRNPHVQDFVLSILTASPEPTTGCVVEYRVGTPSALPGSTSATLQAEPPVQPAYYLNTTNASSVVVGDMFGNSTALIAPDVAGTVPNVSNISLDERSRLIVLLADQTYTITFRTSSDPILLELTRGTNQSINLAVRYLDLALPPNVTALLKITPQGPETLRYDTNGDGTFESTVSPTVYLSGGQANDVEPPVVDIDKVGSTITVRATDDRSGVSAIFYSTDGTTYRQYTSPLATSSLHGATLYVFAQDRAGNRSGRLPFALETPLFLPLTQR